MMENLKINPFKTLRKTCVLSVVFALLFTAGGCTSRQAFYPPFINGVFPEKALEEDAGLSWRACRFKMVWPEGEPVNWTADVMLAHGVVGPVIREYGSRVLWWRFHRRAVRDNTGHQFSFMFYTDTENAKSIMDAIRETRMLKKAMEANIVAAAYFEDPGMESHPEIEAFSDPNWSPEMQRSWPSFIMGVSALWLGLINDLMEDVPPEDMGMTAVMQVYEDSGASVTAMWQKEGQHALLHHLNAIFGYAPLWIKKGIRF